MQAPSHQLPRVCIIAHTVHAGNDDVHARDTMACTSTRARPFICMAMCARLLTHSSRELTGRPAGQRAEAMLLGSLRAQQQPSTRVAVPGPLGTV